MESLSFTRSLSDQTQSSIIAVGYENYWDDYKVKKNRLNQERIFVIFCHKYNRWFNKLPLEIIWQICGLLPHPLHNTLFQNQYFTTESKVVIVHLLLRFTRSNVREFFLAEKVIDLGDYIDVSESMKPVYADSAIKLSQLYDIEWSFHWYFQEELDPELGDRAKGKWDIQKGGGVNNKTGSKGITLFMEPLTYATPEMDTWINTYPNLPDTKPQLHLAPLSSKYPGILALLPTWRTKDTFVLLDSAGIGAVFFERHLKPGVNKAFLYQDHKSNLVSRTKSKTSGHDQGKQSHKHCRSSRVQQPTMRTGNK